MKSQNLKRNVHDVPTGILPSDGAEERGKNRPTPAEIRERAFEIHMERDGIHCLDLEDWLQAERELREKYHRDNDGRAKKK